MRFKNRGDFIQHLVRQALQRAMAGHNSQANLVVQHTPIEAALEFHQRINEAFSQLNRRRRRDLMHRECRVHAFSADGSEDYVLILVFCTNGIWRSLECPSLN